MKLAILGTGKIVDEVLPVLKEINGIAIEAILSTPRSLEKAHQLAKLYDITQATSDYDSLLANPNVDTVYVALPNHLHYAYAKKALLAGKHVICEKPFTMTLDEFEDLTQIAEQQQRILLEAITNQYLGNFTSIKANLAKLGEIKIVTCNYSQYSSRYDAFKRGEIAPAFDPQKGGGALRDLNIYNIHLVVGLFGKPQRVQYLANMEREVDTSGILLMDYGDFKAVCIGAKDCAVELTSTIQGNKGSLAILGATNTLPEIALALNEESKTIINENTLNHRMHDEFVAFQAIIEQENMTATKLALDHSRLVMEVLEQAVQIMWHQ